MNIKAETIKAILVENTLFVILLLAVALYYVYYTKFRCYIHRQENNVNNSNKPRGKCPPFFPNGWYRLLNSHELQIHQVRHVDYCGRNVVLFRGANGKAYALDAYCSHMGANLGLGGKVKNNCIQCPFHGWAFDGETGAAVLSAENSTPKQVSLYEYNSCVKDSSRKDGAFLAKCFEGSVNLKKYHIREYQGSLLIWYDSREKFQDPVYEPLSLDEEKQLDYRGESINFVNCHIQEVPENG
jgi:cholesterol 7-dehydrogenase